MRRGRSRSRSSGSRGRRRPRRTPAVGLTGGIASGKSEVAAVFRRMGALVIGADDEARRIIASDRRVAARVRRILGPDAFGPDGRPARRAIASRIFSNPRLRRRLDAAVHPAVIASIRRSIARARSARTPPPLIVVEAALIYEAGMVPLFDAVAVVDAPASVRIARIRARDGLSRADALRRIRSQASAAAKARAADVVILNRGDLRSLRRAARFVFGVLTGLPAAEPPA